MNRRQFLRASGAAALASSLSCRLAAGAVSPGVATPSIVPRPAKISPLPGVFRLTAAVAITASTADRASAEQLADYLRPATGYTLPITGSGGAIFLRTDPALTAFGREGYRLAVNPQQIELAAADPAGLFFGIQTVRQLFPPAIFSASPIANAAWEVPCVLIEDGPRFRWRGLSLDCGHHFQPLADVLRYVDLMSFHKLNVFHWHLTDLGCWPLEIIGEPGLTNPATRGPGTRAGIYSQQDVRNVVRFAAERHITVVPEVDVPGHVRPVLRVHPDFDCPLPPDEGPGQFCLGNDAIYPFIEKIFDQVRELFPSEFIHIGGDECDLERWAKCPRCQAFRQKNGLADSKAMQGHFTAWLANVLSAKGRRVIGWDEILAAPLPPGAAIMSWHGTSGGVAAARAGHDVVMAPSHTCYFDYPPSPRALEAVYRLNPVADMEPGAAAHVLGAEAEMWTDHHPRRDQIDRLVYPRALALAEMTWTPLAEQDYADFLVRLPLAQERLDRLGLAR